MEARGIRLQGEHGISRQPLRRECRSVPTVPVCSCAHLTTSCTRDRGCSVHPAFPAPSVFEGGEFRASLGRSASRERETISIVIASAAKQSIARRVGTWI